MSGVLKAESITRARVMERHEKGRVRDKISPNGSMANSFIYMPIEDWTNDDVWMFLLESPNPWGRDNADLFHIYKGASPDNECPMVVDSGTPSCGDSRFGCWVCTLVEKDKSMQAMIHNDEEKKWMTPLLKIRAEIDFRAMSENGDRHLRDYRRMNGRVQLFNGRIVPGPYKQEFREHLLRRVLETQAQVRKIGPDYVRELSLIRIAELEEIRRIWVVEKHEMEDALPRIYAEATGEDFPGGKLNDGLPFGAEEMNVLRELCGDNRGQYELARELISLSGERPGTKRRGIYQSLQRAVERHLHDDEADALSALEERDSAMAAAGEKRVIPVRPE